MTPSLCILIPCHNEALSVRQVIADHHAIFPEATVLVVDNASTDDTAELARQAQAQVIIEPRKGKARAVISALEIINTDIIIMVDGDGSYPAEGSRILFAEYMNRPTDLVTGIREVVSGGGGAFRPMHQWGSRIFALSTLLVFRSRPRDVFSGLRLFSRRFYKNVPILSSGFELEMELTIQAVDKGFRVSEVLVPFCARTVGTVSKLRTIRDGYRILRSLVLLFRDYKPLYFFGLIALLFLVLGLCAGSLPVYEYFQTGMVGRFPLAILAAALVNISIFTLLSGVISESNLRYHREAFQVRLRNFRSSP